MAASYSEGTADFTKSRLPLLRIQTVRLAFQVIILLTTILFQTLQPEFTSLEVLLPIYVLLGIVFICNTVYLLFFDKMVRWTAFTGSLFFIDAAFITGLILYTGLNQSIFLFLYLVNIILAGFVLQRRGAYMVAWWTSILFSLLLIATPELKGQALYLAVGINNLAFFAVATLSGYLSEQLNFMGSELRAKGKDLRLLKNLNELIIRNITTGLITVDQEGKLVQVNPAAEEILEADIKDRMGLSLEEFMAGALERIRHEDRFDYEYLTPLGEKRILEILASDFQNEEGELAGFILTFQDLTKIRRLEFAVRQSEKLAAVGQLAGGIAHEIRNPLASISGSIQLLEAHADPKHEDDKKLMGIILKEIDRLNNLITEFLDYVKPEKPVDEVVDLNMLLKEVLDMAKIGSRMEGVEQVLRLGAKQAILGNKDKLKQAFLNIVMNAYQAMNERERPLVEVLSEDKDKTVIIHIKDYGVGIEPARVRKIFEPFHTTKPKGTGLGLAITHKILESHGAKVYVESAKGVGTEFILEFPAAS